MNKPVTLKDIARHVGVGNSTVSAVLSRVPSRHVRVSEATRERILEAARQMRYQPNGVARALRYQKTDVIGVYSPPGYLNPHIIFSSQIIGGLHLGCYENDKDLLLHSIHRNRSGAQVYAELADGRIDGLVLFTASDDPVVEQLATSPLPVVVLVNAIAGLPSVVADDAGGSRLLAAHLAQQGHRRIAYIAGPSTVTSVHRRLRGFQEAAQAHGMDVREFHPSSHFEKFVETDLEWLNLSQKDRPTAAVCWNDMTAYNLLEYCRQHGLRVPEDLAVAGFDGLPVSHSLDRDLTTVRAPWMEVASTAIRLLTRHINGEEIADETVLPVELVLGDTA